MSELKMMTHEAAKFRDDRDWKQFHNLKDMILSLNLESSELLELCQWKLYDEDIDQGKAAEELADILYWTLLIANDMGIDITAAFVSKMRQNALKYPVDKFKGSSKKYNDKDPVKY